MHWPWSKPKPIVTPTPTVYTTYEAGMACVADNTHVFTGHSRVCCSMCGSDVRPAVVLCETVILPANRFFCPQPLTRAVKFFRWFVPVT